MDPGVGNDAAFRPLATYRLCRGKGVPVTSNTLSRTVNPQQDCAADRRCSPPGSKDHIERMAGPQVTA